MFPGRAGNAGAIFLDATGGLFSETSTSTITLENGSQLLADVDTGSGFAAGNITLKAVNEFDVPTIFVHVQDTLGKVQLDAATVHGGVITIQAKGNSATTFGDGDVPTIANDKARGILNATLGFSFEASDVFGLSVSNAVAEIDVNADTDIVGSAAATTTLQNAIDNDSNFQVASAAGFPSSGPFVIQVGQEQMLVTGGQGTTTWTVNRGYNGTALAKHSAGATLSVVTVSLNAEADTKAQVKAVNASLAVGIGISTPTATVTIAGDASIVSSGTVAISTVANSNLGVSAKQNFIGPNTKNKSASFTVAFGYTDAVSTATVNAGAVSLPVATWM